jgi:ankyrin repeat protein
MNRFDGLLWHAVCGGDVDGARSAIELGANVNVMANAGTPLHKAADRGGLEMCKLLVSAGADVSAYSSAKRGQWPLHCTIAGGLKGHLDVMRFFLQLGANPNCNRASDGATLLHLAAQIRSPDVDVAEVVRLLVEHGADVNAVNKTKLTPLHQAGGGAPWNLRNARCLVAAGADPGYISPEATQQGKTPFQSAVSLGWGALIDFYIDECGQSLEQSTRDGRSLSQLVAGNAKATTVLNSVKSARAVAGVIPEPTEDQVPVAARSSRSMAPL